MWRSSSFCAVGLAILACSSSGSDDSGNGASGGSANGSGNGGSANGSGNGGSANGSGNGGSANGSGSGGSANGSGSGGSANAGGTGGSAGQNPGFCIVGQKGCVCDMGVCASGLICKNNTCCDQATGDCSPPPINTGSGGSSGTGGAAGNGGTEAAGGSAGSATCTPGVVGPVITDCGYPYASSNPLTSVVFNESEVLRAIQPSGGAPLASIRVFYNDEHALTLGVRHVDVTSASGTTGKDYPVSPLSTNPGHTAYPQTGTNEVSGDYSGLDPSGRPMWPALYVTDITNDPNNRSGDWQQGGTPYNPNAIFGTWKPAVRTVDTTKTPNVTSITPDADPAKNNWNLGGGDPVPAGLTNQGWGTEVRWNLVLTPGRSYRIQVMVHDGDQNKVGGDSGEACVHFCAGASCPEGSAPCGGDGGELCSGSDVCVNGCCITPG